MKLTLLLACLLLAMCGVVVAAWIVDEAPSGHGIPHAQFAHTMQQGGPGAVRHDTIRALGWGFGSLQIVLLVASLLLGVREPARRG
ncbi:MAG: hypothetical protein ACC645_03605, partial [Pirellulales bacterium]